MPGVYCVLTVGRSHQAGPSLRLSITSDREGSSLMAGREAGVLRMERGRGGTCGKKKGSNMATSIISHRAGTVMSLYLLVFCANNYIEWQ